MFCNVLVSLFLTLCVVQYKLSGYAASRNYGFIFGSGVFCSCDERAPKPCCGSVKGRDLLVGNEGPSTVIRNGLVSDNEISSIIYCKQTQ